MVVIGKGKIIKGVGIELWYGNVKLPNGEVKLSHHWK